MILITLTMITFSRTNDMKQRLIILSLHLKISNFQLKFSSITFSKVGDDIVSDVGGAQNCGIQVKFNVFLNKAGLF